MLAPLEIKVVKDCNVMDGFKNPKGQMNEWILMGH